MLKNTDMKKGLLTGLITLCFAALVSAQVPSAVSSAFQQAQPGVSNPSYVQEGPLWKAKFTENGKEVFYAYSAAGAYQFKETTLSKTEVPAPIMENMEQRFSSNGSVNTFEGVAKRELADGTVHYEYQFSNGGSHVEVFYSEAGQIVKRNVFQ